jgi:hypothetical protein
MALTLAPLMFAPLVFAPLVLALFSGLCSRPDFDVDRLPDADREAGEPDDHQADHEQHCARRGIRELALHAKELAHPAAGSRHTVEEEHDATHDAGKSEHQPGKRIDQLQHRQATPEVALPGIRRQLQRSQDKLKPVQSQWLYAQPLLPISA